jgi:hypothetical protein
MVVRSSRLLAQTGVSREFICIDDDSTDATWRVLTGYAARNADMQVHRATGSGISEALNQGIALACGRYIARMDADDICLPGRLAVQAHHLDRHPELGVLGTQACAIDTDGTPGRRLRVPVGSDRVRTALETSSPLIHPTVMMRRDVVLAAGGYRKLFDGAEDYDLWLRIAALAQFDNLPQSLLLYRCHQGQQSRTHPFGQARLAALASVASRLRRTHGRDPLETVKQLVDWRPAFAAFDLSAVDEVRQLTAGGLADNGGTLRPLGAAYLRLACKSARVGASRHVRRRLALACVRHGLQTLRNQRPIKALLIFSGDFLRWPGDMAYAYVWHASIFWRTAASATGHPSNARVRRRIATPGLAGAAMLSWCAAASAQEATPPQFYIGIDYLHMWVKNAPLSVPLVSTGPIESTHHGLLGSPVNGADSTVLYGAPFAPAKGGNDSQSFGVTPGTRATIGAYLDPARRYAVEASGFVLSLRSAGYQAQGDASGYPILGVPVHNSLAYQVGSMTIFPGEDSLPFSLPDDPARARANGIITGGVAIKNTIDLWGAGIRGRASLYRDASWDITASGGFRFLSLSERFQMVTDIQGVSGPYAGQFGEVRDYFATDNHFYGADFGVKVAYHRGPWRVETSAQVAPGLARQTVGVAGGYTSINFGPQASGPEGIFAQPSNEGRRSSIRFAVVTEAGLSVGYALTPNLGLTLGYEHLYYSSVVRPTDQIDRNLPKGQTFIQAAPTISTTSPSRRFQTTDFYAHSITLGLQLRF